MSEYNKNFYSLEEVERCLEASKEFQDGEEIYYFIGALRYVYNENKQLKSQLQQKDNIIKEVKEYLYKHSQYNDGDGIHYIKEDEYCVDYLLDIIDKENK